MFNNPFDSFHKTVASAKEEREQLDRLLTISTATEQFVVGIIGVCLVLLLAWLWFGDIPRSVAFDGVLVQPQHSVAETESSVQALVWSDVDDENVVDLGVPLLLDVAMDDGSHQAFTGRVTSILEIPVGGTVKGVGMSKGLKDSGDIAPVDVGLLRIGIKFDEEHDIASITGRKCRIVVQQGQQSPLDLFGLRRS